MSELAKRSIVAAIGIPFALIIIYFGSIPFFLVIIIISGLALFEFFAIAEKKGAVPHKIQALVFAIAIQSVFLIRFHNIVSLSPFMVAILVFLAFILATFIKELFKPGENPLLNISITITGMAYIIFFFVSVYILREFDHFMAIFIRHAKVAGNIESATLLIQLSVLPNVKWGYFIFSMLGSIWICDSAAYFVGRGFGKNKLYPKISPNKTIEGAVGGLVFAVIAFVGLAYLLIPEIPMIHTVAFGLIVGTIGQIGDLAESMLKRDAGVKDSSHLIPGHGGILDRFDSILFVAPSIFIYFCIILAFNLIS